jgi:hypothetical protein
MTNNPITAPKPKHSDSTKYFFLKNIKVITQTIAHPATSCSPAMAERKPKNSKIVHFLRDAFIGMAVNVIAARRNVSASGRPY